MYQGAGEYIVFSCKCISKVPRTNFLKRLGKLTEHSRAGDSFSCCSADCVEWLGSAEHCTHPVSTNCWHHLKIIVISGRLPVMWIVLTHDMMCGMKQGLHVFRRNTIPRAAEHICAETAKGTWQWNNSPWWPKTGFYWSFWKCPISSPHCWLHRALNQALPSWHYEGWVCLYILAWIRSVLPKQILWPSPLLMLSFMLMNFLEYTNRN